MVAVKKKMCYDGNMNKDVIYIEPEEDITDIIAKIESSKSKIVALVPPKKAGVFRSIVNIKLIAKSASSAGKTVVFVTTDPSITKLAAATKMPVTKDLKTAPEIPETEDEIDETETVDVDDEGEDIKNSDEDGAKKDEDEEKEEEVEETEGADDADEGDNTEKSAKNTSKNDLEAPEDEDAEEEPEDSPSDEKPAKLPKKPEKSQNTAKGKLASSNNPVLRWIGTHKKADVCICLGLVALIIVAIWAFAIAPAVTITLKLETITGNFSENVTFTENLAEEKVSEGKFYIEEKKQENKAEVEFEATGTKNVGEKASGTLTAYYVFKDKGSVSVKAGSTFTYSNLSYAATGDTTIIWGGKDSECKNKDDDNIGTKGCYIYKDIAVAAAEAGASYNISATGTGWVTNAGVTIASGTAMAGGTDKTVTIVQQSDIDKAMTSIATENESENKKKLVDSLGEGQFAIDSSFKQTASDPVSSPKVGEEVESGKKAKLTVTTTDTIFVIDETKLKEFIEEKAKLSDGYRIYSMNDPFVENFVKTDSGYIGKLKTSYVAGSTITENEVVETVKGKGIGTAKRDISDNFSGIKTITIDTSVPWVTSVPGNTEKITVKINVAE